jgi:DNA-binding XRE family transcriptional regulator
MLTICLKTRKLVRSTFEYRELEMDEYKKQFGLFRIKLGEHIQFLRKDMGITQEKLAHQIGLDRVTIGYIEQGVRTPKLSTLFAISKALDVPIQNILPPPS